MFKQVTAVTLTALALGACSMEAPSSEDLGSQQTAFTWGGPRVTTQPVTTQPVTTQPASSEDPGSQPAALTGGQCNIVGLEWKTFAAHLAYDAAEDFGRWEFTTDLSYGDGRLEISPAGYALCASRGRTGCPSMTAGLTAQDGGEEIRNSTGQVIMSPVAIRSNLTQGFLQQGNYEYFQNWMDDPREVAPYNHFQAATQTGLPHTVTPTNCAATLYADSSYKGASQCLRAGNYRMVDLKIGDNSLSSLKVKSGAKVTLYADDRFGGSSMVVTADSGSLGTFDGKASSMVVTTVDTGACSSIDTFKVTVTSGDWTKIRSKLLTLGWGRGNEDLLDLRLDLANQTIDVDPFNVDFVPPSQIGGTTYGVKIKSATAETWRSTEDPAPSIFPVGAACMKMNYKGTAWVKGVVKSVGSYRYCYI